MTTVRDDKDRDCRICWGISYLTRAMIDRGRHGRCIGFSLPLSTYLQHRAVDPTTITNDNTVDNGDDDDFENHDEYGARLHLHSVLCIGKSRIESKSLVSLFGVRVVSLRSDVPATVDADNDVSSTGDAIVAHLNRQWQFARHLQHQISWQVSPEGIRSLRYQIGSMSPIVTNFAKVYVDKMIRFFDPKGSQS